LRIHENINIDKNDDNLEMFLEQQIRVICEGSCDTEDWSNDDKFSFDHRNKLRFIIYSHRK